MKLDATVKGDLKGFKLYYVEESNERITQLTVALKFTRDKARELLGSQFTAVAFAGLMHDGEIPVHGHSGVKVKEPWERHNLKIEGFGPFGVSPEWGGNVTPVKDEEAVIVPLRFPLVITDKATIGALALRFGEVVELALTASQQELPLDGAKAAIVKRPSGPWGNAKAVSA